jgi:hypothetical protein
MAKIPKRRAHRSTVAFVLLGIAFAGSFGPGLVSRAAERRKRDLPAADVVNVRSTSQRLVIGPRLVEAARRIGHGDPLAGPPLEPSKLSKSDAQTTFSLRNEGDVLVTVRVPGEGREARLAPTESVRVSLEPGGSGPTVRLEGGGFSTQLAPRDGASYVVQRIGDALVVRRAGGT